jgi:PAS domain S-box-containing protein
MAEERGFSGKMLRLVVCALILFISSLSHAATRNVLTVGVQDGLPPFSFMDENSRMRGFIIDLTRMIAGMMGLSYKLKLIDGVDVGNDLHNGRVDLVALVDPPADMRDVQFIDTGIPIEKKLFVNKECVTVTCTRDLPGHRLVLDRSADLTRLLPQPGTVEIITANSQLEALTMIEEGKADVYLSPCGRTSVYLIQKMHFFRIMEVGLPVQTTNLVLAVGKGDAALLTDVSMNFGKILENGNLEVLRNKWLGKDPGTSAWQQYLKYVVSALGICLAALLVFAFWNRMLHSRVQQMTKDLHKSEEKYRELIESSPDMIHLISPDGSVRLANKIARARLGCGSEQSGDSKLYDLLAPEDRASAVSFMFSVFQVGFGEMELVFGGRDGVPIHAEMIATTVNGPPGQSPLACCFSRDITERKHLENELIKSERLAIMGRMAAGLAHEINNPLGIILANSEELLGSCTLEGSERQYLETIARNAERAGDILHNLLSFTKPGPCDQAPIDLESIVDESVLFLHQKLKAKRIYIKKDFAGENLTIAGNYGQIQQVVVNLMLNAIQAVPEGGMIIVRIVSSHDKVSPHIRLEVEDNGIGIPEGDLPRIFDPFFTSHKEGFGLGLFLSKTIVERHKGVFDVKSGENRGTLMSVVFPTQPDEYAQAHVEKCLAVSGVI